MAPRKLIAGNWKMNGLAASAAELDAMIANVTDNRPETEVAICPPATLLASFVGRSAGSVLRIGAQDCHASASGAHTGDISAPMIADIGATMVIVGHSERRADHGETDEMIAQKAQAAWEADLTAIICIGESKAQRDAGEALNVAAAQIAQSVPDGAKAANTVIAYEPIWAIGTGVTPTIDQIAQVHGFLRAELVKRFGEEGAGMRLLYGGSMKPGNAAEILAVADVDGGLIGGASLKAADFLQIVAAAG